MRKWEAAVYLATELFEPEDCWPAPPPYTRKGYKRVHVGSDMVMLHRVAWTLLRGPIPEGAVIDHVCRNRPCFNPDHMRLCAPVENIQAVGSLAISQAYKTRTECNQGHPFTPENTLRFPSDGTSNRRRCRTCKQATDGRYRARKLGGSPARG